MSIIAGSTEGMAADAPVGGDDPPTPQPMTLMTADGTPMGRITRTETPPVIDGTLDDEAWQNALQLSGLRQVEPDEGAPASFETVIYLTFDTNALYVAFRCYDDDPSSIIATQMKRDVSLGSDDHVNFVIDPLFNQRNGYYFETNPLGARGDALVEENSRTRKDWDGIWTAKSNVDDEGWTAEFAIPFKTISFDPDTTKWGFNAMRFIRRKNELNRWATPDRNIAIQSLADAGVIEGITDINQGIGLDFKPYGVQTLGRRHLDDEYVTEGDVGFDLFYKLTPSLTLALTYNTDFAETEVDERRVNLTRFPLFFPEKRDFFLQDAGVFSFGGIGNNPLPFQSRRIGLGPDGETVDILAGAKLTGRIGDLNLGLLNVQMAHDDELGSKNLFVGRASVNVLEQSTVGVIATSGDPRTDGSNTVAGADFNYRISDYDGDKVVEAHAWILCAEDSDVDGTETAYGFKVRYPNDRISWTAGYTEIGDEFDAALGFVPRNGIREYFANWRYRIRPESDWIRSIDFGPSFFLVTNRDNDVESADYSMEIFDIDTEAGDSFDVDISREREVLEEEFEISDGVIVPVGDYEYDRYSLSLRTSRGRPVNFSLSHRGGDFLTGRRNDYGASVTWRASPNLNMGLEYSMNDVQLPQGDFITRIYRGRLNIAFSPDLTWSTFAQYDNVSESIGVNSRVQWIIEPGNEVFFVINQAIDREDDSYRVRETELTAKIGWTFRF